MMTSTPGLSSPQIHQASGHIQVIFGPMFSGQTQILPALSATALSEMKETAEKFDIIGIDEGQFFPDIVQFCDEMANQGKIVIVAALDGTFQRKGFGEILILVPLAENIIKLSAVCMTCSLDGHFTKRTPLDKSVEG